MARTVMNIKQRLSVIQFLTEEKRKAFQESRSDWKHIVNVLHKELGIEIKSKDILLRLLNDADIPIFFPMRSDVPAPSAAEANALVLLKRNNDLIMHLYKVLEVPLPEGI